MVASGFYTRGSDVVKNLGLHDRQRISCVLRFTKTGLCHGFVQLREVHPGLVQVLSSFTRRLYSDYEAFVGFTPCADS